MLYFIVCIRSIIEDLQHEMYSQVFELENSFYSFNDDEKLVFLFTSYNMIKTVAKTCKDILDRWVCFLYK